MEKLQEQKLRAFIRAGIIKKKKERLDEQFKQALNKNKLRSIIHNKEISDWIFNVKNEEKKGFFNFLTRNKKEERQKNLVKINSILDKMEAWGEWVCQ